MTTQLVQKYSFHDKPYITDTELKASLKGSANSRYGLIKRALAKGELIRIKRGLYILGKNLTNQKPDNYQLAQYIYHPSYISLESALAYHGLIPEAVYTVTSVTFERKKTFYTPIGVFAYLPIPITNFFHSVERIKTKNTQFFMASPWKAILDYIYCYKKEWRSLKPLQESLRVEFEELPLLSNDMIWEFCDFYKSRRIKLFLQGI